MAIDKDQLDLATKLNAIIDQIAKGAQKLEQSFESQVTIVERLAAAMGKVDTRQARKELDALNDTKLDSLQKAIDDTTTSSSSMLSKLQDVAETLEKKFPTSAAIAVAGISGLHQGIRNMIAMTKGTASFFSTVTSGLFNITASVVAIPFKLLTGLVGFAANATMGSNELRQAIEALRKEFGTLAGPTNKTITTMSFSLKGFKDTGLSTWRVFGTLAERFQAFRELAHSMGPEFQLLTSEFKENGGAILAYQKGLGVSNEEMKGVADKAITSNKTFASVLKDVTKYSLEMGKSFGIDGKLISRDMGKALGDVKHFAGATIKQITEADVYARKLGLSLEKITGTLDAFETFDSAAENVSKLSQAFGVQVDAFKLMEKQDPASQLDELRKAFLKTGKSADTMSRQELKLLAQTTGLDEATAKMAFSSKNQGVSMDEIRKKSGEAEKKTLTQAEAMKKLADSIERLVKQGGSLPNSFFAAFIKGFTGGVQASKPFRMMIYDIRESLRETIRQGVKLGRTFVDIFPGIKDLFTGLDQLFKPKKFRVFMSGIRQDFTQFFKDLTTGNFSFEKLMGSIRKSFFDFFDVEAGPGRDALEGFKTTFATLAKIAASGTRWIADKIAEGIGSITDFIRDPKKMLQRLKVGATEGGSFVATALAPMLDSLEHAWTVITPALSKLFKVVGNKLVAFLKSDDFKSVAVPVAEALAGVMFGPVFSHIALAAGTAALARASVGLFTGAGKKGISAIIEKAGSVAQNMVSAKKMGQGAESIASSGSLLKAGSVASEAAKGSSAIDFKSLAQKLLALIAVVTAVGLVSAGIAWLLKKVASPKELDAAGTIMLKMSGVFLAMIPLLAASTAIGAVVDLSAGAVLIPMATGFGVIATAVGLMAAASVGIIKSLSALKIDESFQPKINAFLSVMQAIGTFTGAIVSIVNASAPSLLDFLSGTSEKFSTKLNAATKLVKSMTGGMVGIVGSVTDAIKQLNLGGPGIADAAHTFQDVISVITSFMKFAAPPPAFYEAGGGFLARVVGGKNSFKDLSASISTYVGVVRDGAMKMLLGDGNSGGIISVIKELAQIPVPDAKAVEAVTGLLAATAQIIAALTPSPETIKAFSYSVEKSSAFGLIKNASNAIDTKGMADVMTTMGAQLKTLLPVIMSTVTGTIITQASKIGDKLDSVKALTEVFRAIIDLSSSLGSISVKPQGADQSGLLDAVQRIVGKDGNGGQVTMASELIASSQGAVTSAVKNVQGFGHSMQKVADAIKTGGVVAALGAVEQMVKQANALDAALNAGTKINIPAKLEAVARGVGLGKSGTFKVTNKDVVINVNFEISMDVDKVEKVMVLRQKSILRDRLNYLTDASKLPQLPDNTSSPIATAKQGTP